MTLTPASTRLHHILHLLHSTTEFHTPIFYFFYYFFPVLLAHSGRFSLGAVALALPRLEINCNLSGAAVSCAALIVNHVDRISRNA